MATWPIPRTPHEDNAAVIQMINKRRSPSLRHVTSTHRVDLHWLLERVNWPHFILITNVRTNDQLADILTKGMFTTMQGHSLLTLWQLRRPYESNEVRSLSRKTFLLMSQVMTQTESVDQIWSQYASNIWKSGCALDNHLTLEQLNNYEFFVHKTRGIFLQECSSP